MDHFSEQPLVDFVRGISGPEISRDVRAHLGTGCPKCKTAVNAWSRVRRLATQDAAYAPPENLVRLVKLGLTNKPALQPRMWPLASMVFDSFAQPLLAGVRSGAVNVWQVIYEAEGLTVDLCFGRRTRSNAVHLIGQVLDKQQGSARPNTTVELSNEHEQLVATTAVNPSGEFQVEFEAKGQLWLWVRVEGRNTVRIPLTNPR